MTVFVFILEISLRDMLSSSGLTASHPFNPWSINNNLRFVKTKCPPAASVIPRYRLALPERIGYSPFSKFLPESANFIKMKVQKI